MVATKYFVREAIKNMAKLGILSQPRRTPFPISILRFKKKHKQTRSLGALRDPTSSWRPFGPLDFVLRALRALRPCDPHNDVVIG